MAYWKTLWMTAVDIFIFLGLNGKEQSANNRCLEMLVPELEESVIPWANMEERSFFNLWFKHQFILTTEFECLVCTMRMWSGLLPVAHSADLDHIED